jgi:hypothetical protein
MDSLQEEILGIIEVCRSALAVPKKMRPSIDARTIKVARRILARLKDYDTGGGATFATIRLDEHRLNWWEILYAMEAAERFLERWLARG